MYAVRTCLAVLSFFFIQLGFAASDPVAWSLSPAKGFPVTHVRENSSVTYTFTNKIPFTTTLIMSYVRKNDAFTIQDNCNGVALKPNASCTVGITFAPQNVTSSSIQVIYGYGNNRIPLPTLSAIAAPIERFTVTANGDAHVAATPASQIVDYDSTSVITVNPDVGYNVAVNSSCGGSLSGNTFTTGPVTNNCTVNFSSSIKSFAVNASGDEHVKATPTTQNADYNTSAQITVSPDAGYTVRTNSSCGAAYQALYSPQGR